MPKLTNTGTVQPLGVPGVLGAIEPGQTHVIAQADWDLVKDKPVLRHWVETGLIVVEDDEPVAEATKPAKAQKPTA